MFYVGRQWYIRIILLRRHVPQQQYPPFWPEGRHSKKYGPVFTIDHISHNHYSNIKTWLFRINKKVCYLAPNDCWNSNNYCLHFRLYRWPNWWLVSKHRQGPSNCFSSRAGHWGTGCRLPPIPWSSWWTWSRGGDRGSTTGPLWSCRSEYRRRSL